MIRKILKWTGISLGSLIVLLLAAWVVMYISVTNRRNKKYEVKVREIVIPADSASIAEGKRLFSMKGCADCHGANLSGKTVMDDPAVGRFSGTNLTSGKGGVPANRPDHDWLLALRHGLNAEGKSLFIMPSYELYKLDDKDISSLIAYMKSVAPVDNHLPENKLGPVGVVLAALDKIPIAPAEMVDHTYKQPQTVEKGVTVAYGEYLSAACSGCHHANFKGGPNPVPGGKAVADISGSGNVGKWTGNQFVSTMRTGKTPEGKTLLNADMPWKMTAEYSEDELKALHLYLASIK